MNPGGVDRSCTCREETQESVRNTDRRTAYEMDRWMGRDRWLHSYVCGVGFLHLPTDVCARHRSRCCGRRDTRDQVSHGKLDE